jgi:hypothetical protein
MLIAGILIVVASLAVAVQEITKGHPVQYVRDLKALADLAKRVRQVRINAYNVLATSWCDGSLVREQTGEYVNVVRDGKVVTEPDYYTYPYDGSKQKPVREWVEFDTPKYEVCLEGGILVGAGFPAAELYEVSQNRYGSINDVLRNIDTGNLEAPETFDAEAASEAMRQMAGEIEREARFRRLVQSNKVRRYDNLLVPELLGINDDQDFGQPVILEVVRDNLFDAPDEAIVEEAERRLRVREYADA